MASTVDNVISLSKRRGFVYQCGEIYGGTKSAWDYGPLGVELKDNIKRQWWRSMVQSRDDVVGLDSSVILPTDVWKASGHLAAFVDPLVECRHCHNRFRQDHLQESYAEKKGIDDPDTVTMDLIACTNCGTRGEWTEPRMFNGLLKTYLGPVESEEGLHYLRPETAQGIFVNFSQVMTTARKKPPFGIGQIGKSFRNEITPGNFIFRTREFEQMEMEFFVEPGTDEEWHETWIKTRMDWYTGLGINPDNLRLFEHPQDKLSHYSKRTVDIEYRFEFAGSTWGELEGIANRTDFDLKTHSEHSGKDLTYFDQPNNERWTPYVIEPAAGRQPLDDGVPDRCVRRGAGAERQGWHRRAYGPQARSAPRAGQGRRAAAVAQRGPVAQGACAGRRAAWLLERRLRRRPGDRQALPPAGRDRHAVLHHGRLRHPRRPGRHDPRARLDDAGAHRARPGDVMARGASARLLIRA